MDGYDENAVYSITFEMLGDYSEQITKSGTIKELQSQSFSFTNLLVGSKVKFRCTLYYHDGTPGGKAIWSGESDEIEIAEGANNVSIKMKKQFDEIVIFNRAAFMADLEANYSDKVTFGERDGAKVIKSCSLEKYAVPYGYKKIESDGQGSVFMDCEKLKTIILPDSIEELGDGAFGSCTSLENISLPDSIKAIGTDAFGGCVSLTSIVIPDRVTSIGEYTFYNCEKLKDIVIPDGVTAIGDNAFNGCSALETLNLPKKITSISSGMFQDSGLTSIVIPESVTEIGDSAFYGCTNLETVTLPKPKDAKTGLITLGRDVFKYKDDTGVEELIPNLKICVPYGGMVPQSGGVITPYYQNYRDIWHDCAGIIHTPFTSADYAKAENAGTREYYTVPDGYTMISENAFAYRANLKGVTIPAEVESIEANAFIDCDNLVSIALKSNTKIAMPVRPLSIDPDTAPDIFNGGNESVRFYVSDSLANDYETDYTQTRFHYNFVSNILTKDTIDNAATNGLIPNFDPAISDICDIPYGYTAIDDASYSSNSVFQACKDTLTTVILPETLETIGVYAFYNCSKLETVILPSSLKSIKNYAFQSCSTLATLQCAGLDNGELPDGLTEIGTAAFNSCKKLPQIIIPGSVMSIGTDSDTNGVFEECIGLKTIIIKDGVQIIGRNAFTCSSSPYNTNITSIEIPKSVTTIGKYAFRWMQYESTGTFTLTFTSGDHDADTMTIMEGAFQKCHGLTTVTLPNNLTALGTETEDYVFSECKNLETVAFENGSKLTLICNNAFESCSKLKSISVPDSVTSIGNYAFQNCSNLGEVNFSSNSNLTSIGQNAFRSTSITSITIPAKVTSIGSSAFYYCLNLAEVHILSTANNISIGSSAFESIKSGADIYLYTETPPTLASWAFSSNLGAIYVPSTAVSDYQSATNWSSYAS